MLFCGSKAEYLGYFISGDGVSTDPVKIEAMINWSSPQSVKQLRGFLGLAIYYKRFVYKYGFIAKPLTYMLKKGQFLMDR